ncbi:hypothetical protein GV51_0886 [Gardnerella vaginalis 5-1]|nr:hypothetical protein GV51_0886 [Gardnerella vaginalis 5-1]
MVFSSKFSHKRSRYLLLAALIIFYLAISNFGRIIIVFQNNR